MEPKQPGNQKLPDFHELTDRIIVEKPSEPMIVIKTKLDPKDSTENNPYYHSNTKTDTNTFRDYFE